MGDELREPDDFSMGLGDRLKKSTRHDSQLEKERNQLQHTFARNSESDEKKRITKEKNKERNAKRREEQKEAVAAQYLNDADMYAMNAANMLDELTEENENKIVNNFRSSFKHDLIARSSCAIDGEIYLLRELTLVEVKMLPLEVMREMYKGPSDISPALKSFYSLENEDNLLKGK